MKPLWKRSLGIGLLGTGLIYIGFSVYGLFMKMNVPVSMLVQGLIILAAGAWLYEKGDEEHVFTFRRVGLLYLRMLGMTLFMAGFFVAAVVLLYLLNGWIKPGEALFKVFVQILVMAISYLMMHIGMVDGRNQLKANNERIRQWNEAGISRHSFRAPAKGGAEADWRR